MNPQQPQLPTWWVIFIPALAIGWAGAKIQGESFTMSNPGPGLMTGAVLGLLLGVAVFLDNKRALRRMPLDSIASGSNRAITEATSQPANRPSERIALLMLMIPAVSALFVWQRQRFGLSVQMTSLLSFGAIISTSVLGYLDGRQLKNRCASDTDSSKAFQPAISFVGMLGMWALCFPAYFVVRRNLGARSFVLPAIVVTLLFMGSNLTTLFAKPELPRVDSPEVMALVTRMFSENPEALARKDEIGKITVQEPVEVSYDESTPRRTARAKLVSNMSPMEIFYIVEWHEIGQGSFSVRIIDKP